MDIRIGAKLAVAPVARATPLFLPCPEIIYINVLHYYAPPRTYLVPATLLLSPDWRHWLFLFCKWTNNQYLLSGKIFHLSILNPWIFFQKKWYFFLKVFKTFPNVKCKKKIYILSLFLFKYHPLPRIRNPNFGMKRVYHSRIKKDP